MNKIDLVYPCHAKDKETLEICIKYARKNIKNLRNIYIVSKTKLTDSAIWISEDIFPFTFQTMIDKIGNHNKTGWYYAGWIHLYSILCIPNILDNVLICDADTIFCKEVEFVNDLGQSLFNISNGDGTALYLEHNQKVIPGLTNQLSGTLSCVCHHILINKTIMNDLVEKSEAIHKKPFWELWIDVSKDQYNSCHFDNIYKGNERHKLGPGRVTSYELYGQYALKYFPDKVKIRPLNSIFAYKGFLNIKNTDFTKSHKSRSNKGSVVIVPENIEKSLVFDTFEECIEFHINECIKQDFDSVTFQNHTREGSNKITGNGHGDKR